MFKIVESLWEEFDVRRGLIRNGVELCAFLGEPSQTLLPLLITSFNGKEWDLRVELLDIVVGLSVYIGKKSFAQNLLPCLEAYLNDPRPPVIERFLEAFTALTELQFFESQRLLSFSIQIVPLVCHYSAWVRNGCINFILAVTKALGEVRAHCRLLPILEPFLAYPIVVINRSTLLYGLKPPLDHKVFNIVLKHCAEENVDENVRRFAPDLYDDQPLFDAMIAYAKGIYFCVYIYIFVGGFL